MSGSTLFILAKKKPKRARSESIISTLYFSGDPLTVFLKEGGQMQLEGLVIPAIDKCLFFPIIVRADILSHMKNAVERQE